MRTTRTSNTRLSLTLAVTLAAGLATLPAFGENGDEDKVSGSVEILYRNVSQGGSTEKFEEDLDLESGVRLGSLNLDFDNTGGTLVDYARLEATGLGGDPEEYSRLKLGRKDAYDLTVRHTKVDYKYNLFELVSNEDGAFWDSERRNTDIHLRVFPSQRVKLVFQYHEGTRRGDSLFMKDISRDVFRFETPLDATTKHYTVGADLEVGPVDIVFRQTLRRYDNQFDNSTENTIGLENTSTLFDYHWTQNDSGSTDWTTLNVHAALGERVDVTVGMFGTFLGEETVETRVTQDLDGIGFNGLPISVVGGTAETDLDGDSTILEADVTVAVIDGLDVHVQYRSLNRELEGDMLRDLDGDGTEDDQDGDGFPGTQTLLDWEVDTATVFVDYRPTRRVGLKAGFRSIDRDLTRQGFGTLRDTDFESDGDDTVLFGVAVRPTTWLRFNADYEDGEIDQPFNAVAPEESEHIRARAVFTPQEDMRIDASFTEFEITNEAPDLRDPGSVWSGDQDGSSHAVSFWHAPRSGLDYLFRYAEQEVESVIGVTFDTAGFGAVEQGDSIVDVESSQLAAHINYSWAPEWKVHLRYLTTESEGNNVLLGSSSGLVNDEQIEQDYDDTEVGVTYRFESGLWVGVALRDFDYDDGGRRLDGMGTVLFRNNGLDYDGEIFTIKAGLSF
jgi:hypothetical protein